MANSSVIRFPRVRDITGLSRSTIWRLENDQAFPARVQLSKNSVGWYAEEILTWIDARNRGRGTKPQRKSHASR